MINHSVSSADPAYSGIYAAGVPVSVASQTSGVVQVVQSGGSTNVVANSTPAAATDTYTLKLTSLPAVATVAYVTVAAALPPSNYLKQGGGSVLVSADGVHFAQSIVLTYDTSAPIGSVNAWGRIQTIYVRAVSDNSEQPEQTVIISHSIQSANAAYNDVPIANVEVDRIDAKTPGLAIVQTAANQDVVIGGATATYTVALTQKPLAGETVSVALSTDTHLVLSAANAGQAGQFNAVTNTITFNASNWNVPFVVKVTGATGPALQSPTESDIFASTSSSLAQGVYSAVIDMPETRFQVADSRVGQVIVTPSGGSTIVSAGNPDTYTLQLSKAPTAPVTVSLLTDGKTLVSAANPDDTRFAVVNGVAQVTFDATNWNVAFTVQVAINPNAPPSVGEPVQTFAAQPQTTGLIQGSLILEGDTIPSRDRSFHAAIILPTEKDTPLPVVVAATDFTKDTDTLNVFNAGSISNDTGGLGQAQAAGAIATDYGVQASTLDMSSYGLISGLNMGTGTSTNYGTQQTPNIVKFDGGITYHGFEVVDVLLGQGDDTFNVSATTAGSITVVQGGGGSDHLTATGGGGASPLVLLGDTTQNGAFYNATTANITGEGREFSNPGNDVLDASADPNTVVLYGGTGNDSILGGAGSDWIAGGSGADTINGGGGNDIIFGDSGFNLNLSKRISLASQVLLVTATTAPTDDKLTSDKLITGADTITGGTGNEIIIGDLGTVTQIGGLDAILSTANVLSVQTANAANGANDTINLGAGNNIVLGGSGADTITALAGNHIILGDNGRVTFASPGVLSSIVSTDPGYGGDDLITLSAGNDIVIGGVGNDTITASDGNQTIIGDDGRLTYTGGLLIAAQTSDPAYGGNDLITVGLGNDVILGGSGQDTIKAGAGNDVILGDNGQILYASPGVLGTVQSTDVVVNVDGFPTAYGDNDVITVGSGNDVILGGLGSDLITTGDGSDIVMGDDGKLSFTGGLLLQAQTTNPSYGGDDTITLGVGNDVVFGGQGNDKITAGKGNQVIVGDNGRVVYSMPGVLQLVSTSDPLFGGNDVITVGDGNDEILGGVGNDIITVGAGQTVIVGDDGALSYNAAGLLMMVQTLDPTYGGNDTITGVDTNYIIFGGAGNDTIKAGDGNDVVVGDNGLVRFSSPGVLQWVIAIDPVQVRGDGGPNYTADDNIMVGNGDNFILGGVGSDVITAGAGHDLVIGDDGALIFVATVTTVGDADWLAFGSGESQNTKHQTVFSGGLLTVATTANNPSAGGGDTITVGNANDIVIGGAGNDTINAGSGVDTVIGDNGAVTYSAAGVLLQIATMAPVFGGNDAITTGGGDDYILGGVGNDTISAIVGESVIFGDDGVITFVGGLLTKVQSTDTIYGGDDTITVGQDDNIIIGGVCNDSIIGGDGDNLVTGDNGLVVFSTPGVTGSVQASDPVGAGYTADDTIVLGAGHNFVLGGLGNDTITTGAGNDVVLGDDGLLTFSGPVAKAGIDNPLAYGVAPVYDPHGTLVFASGLLVTAQTANAAAGGNDVITVANGHELVIGGAGNDTITAGDGTDIVIGDNGIVSYTGDGALAAIATSSPAYGGGDTISTGAGNDFVLAGTGNDTILAGNGSNVILGDNGALTFAGGLLLTAVVALDPPTVAAVAPVDADKITVGSGRNFILGGAGDDIVSTGPGSNLVIGDDGTLLFGAKAVSAVLANSLSFGADQVSAAPAMPPFFGTLLLSATATNPAATGNDTITTSTGNDLVIGGNGSDAIDAGAGDNIVIGDDGAVTYSALGVLTTIATAAPSYGGADQITVADGTDYVLGGVGSDTIMAGNGNDVLLGDDGQISFVAGQLAAIISTDASYGGGDAITAGNGNVIIVAGVGSDRVQAGDGNSIVIGDNGNVMFATPGVLARVQTTYPASGGDDTISVGGGYNFVLGGVGNDTITTGGGSNVVVGDDATLIFSTPWVTVGQSDPLAFGAGVAIDAFGDVTFTGGVLTTVTSTDTASGGNDTITTGAGPNVIIGGAGDDQITSPDGTNIVFGDNGQVGWTNKGVLTSITTIDPTTGGKDVIGLGDGNNDVLGGLGDDTMTIGNGDNVVLGDDGALKFSLGMLASVATLDTALGGADAITVGAGDNVVLGGVGSDIITTGDGNNLVVGDNGQVVYAMPGVLGTVTASDPAGVVYLADDQITVGGGDNFLIGGAGSDTITAGDGNNVVIGDDALLTFASNPLALTLADPLAFGAGIVPDAFGSITFTGGVLIAAQTINPSLGGNDAITVGQGNNLLIGGAGKDAIIAGDGVNMVIGDDGQVTYSTVGVLLGITTSDPASGDDDTITVGLGGDFILGGVGSDTITAGIGNNVVIGDDGSLAFSGGYLSVAKTLDPSYGGDDVISADANSDGLSGANILIGGAGGDTIQALDGGNVVIGDNGEVDFASPGVLATVTTSDPGFGGDDQITVGQGANFILAGVGNDTVETGDGNDVVFGDDAVLIFSPLDVLAAPDNGLIFAAGIGAGPDGPVEFIGGVLTSAVSTDLSAGGDDAIYTGYGHDLVVGGAGSDTISSPAGVDIAIGDNGQVLFNAQGVIQSIAAIDPLDGGGDTITLGDDGNYVAGGMGDDQISTGIGNDVILGDDGLISFADGQLIDVHTTDVSYGGDDTIIADRFHVSRFQGGLFGGGGSQFSPGGDNIVLGGVGSDTITAGDGDNIVIGDNGDVSFVTPGVLATITALDPVNGGTNPVYTANDSIDVGDGFNFILGGVGADTITAGNGNNAVIGDDGVFTFSPAPVVLDVTNPLAFGYGYVAATDSGYLPDYSYDSLITPAQFTGGVLLTASSLNPADGGDDVITTGDGNDLIIGGSGNDAILSGQGTNIVLGDDGQVTFDANGVLLSITTSDPAYGGNDTITTGDGTAYVAAGVGADKVTLGSGADVVIGDDGTITFTAGQLISVATADPSIGGGDIIMVGSGNDILIGGVGSDTITATDGNDLVIGDNGAVAFAAPGVLGTIATSDPAYGGDDTITTGLGNSFILAGIGNDTVLTGDGNNVVFGDDALLTFDPATPVLGAMNAGAFAYSVDVNPLGIVTLDSGLLVSAVSTDSAIGGNDHITTGAGHDLIVGGAGADWIAANDGNNVVIGDNGQVAYDKSGVLLQVTTFDPADGGNDTITAGRGKNVILGGVGADGITVGDGDNAILGDDGLLTFAAALPSGTAGVVTFPYSQLTTLQTLDPAAGGADTIKAGNGNDILVGGFGGDKITAGDGNDIALGDNGQVQFSLPGIVASITTTDPTQGGNDQILLGGGNDFVLGGVAADTIKTGDGSSVVLGDDGLLSFGNGLLSDVHTTDAAIGGADAITLGNGRNVVFGGAGADRITAGNGDNIVVGDDGDAYTTPGVISGVSTTDPTVGGNDIITLGYGRNFVLGGAGADTIITGNGNNVVFGDDATLTASPTAVTLVNSDALAFGYGASVGPLGRVTFLSGVMTTAQSIDPGTGGNDKITAGSGHNLVVGGTGDDTITTGTGMDIVTGDDASVVYTPTGLQLAVQSIDPTIGGADKITTAGSLDTIIGGGGADTINAGAGRNIVLGDDGWLGFTASQITGIMTSDPALGGADTIGAGDGDNIILGGAGNDAITVGNGTNIILGDDGTIGFSALGMVTSVNAADGLPLVPSVVARAPTAIQNVLGDDTITAGSGHNFILGGAGKNTITAGGGGNVVLGGDGTLLFTPGTVAVDAHNPLAFGLGVVFGAHGQQTFTGGILTSVLSADPTIVGDNTIKTGAGHDLIIAGAGNDTVSSGNGADILIGDDGQVLFTQDGVLQSVSSTEPGVGGVDSLTTGDGNAIILGGTGNDTISVGTGNAVILGDDGIANFNAGTLSNIQTSDPVLGGDDLITALNGDDIVLGGAGADTIRLGLGRDVVLGDNGAVSLFADGAVSSVASSDPQYGGIDTVTLGDGDNIVIGGAGADSLTVGRGNNVVFGDGASLTYADITLDGDAKTLAFSGRIALGANGFITFSDGMLLSAVSTDPTIGGDDSIAAGSGQNLIVGGAGNDTVTAGDGANIVIGDNGQVTYTSAAIISTIQTINPESGGGADAITLGNGTNIVLGGLGADAITLGNGRNIALGDDGQVSFTNGSYYRVAGHDWDEVTDGIVGDVKTIDPALGGGDTIMAGTGDNLIMGGVGNDTISVATGDNVILGGNGEATFAYGFVFASIASNNSAYAGVDQISTGGGHNIILQGSVDQSVPRLQLPVWQAAASVAPSATAAAATPISAAQLNAVVLEAEQIWTAALGPADTRLATLAHVTVELGDLPADKIGATYGDTIVIDSVAAGWGWFTGTTAQDDADFMANPASGVFTAVSGTAAAGHMDLLSTVLHEMGNAMGFAEDAGDDVTGRVLQAGERRLPMADALDLIGQSPIAGQPARIGVAVPAVPVALPLPANTASWISDFVNHSGQDETMRSPNAGIRVIMPTSDVSARF